MSEQQPPWPDGQGGPRYPGPPPQQGQPPYPGAPGQPPQGHNPPPGYAHPQPGYGPQPPGYGQQPAYGGQPAYGQQPGPAQPYPGYQQRPPAPAPDSNARLIGWLIAATGVIVGIAAFLTWGTVEFGGRSIDINGVTGTDMAGDDETRDGVITVVLALAAIAFGVVRGVGRLALTAAIIGLVIAALVVIVAIVDMADISDSVAGAPSGVEASIGIGLWLTLAGGIAMAAVSVAGLVKRR